MIRPDGTQPAPMGFTGGKAVNVPWGVSIDGNDDVWIGNFWGRGVVLMAGDDTKGHPGAPRPATPSTSSRAAASRWSPTW